MSELKPEDKKLHEALNKAMTDEDFYDTILEAAQAKKIEQLQAENEKMKELLERVYVMYPKFSNIKQRALMLEIEQALKGE